jgi:hypothetical protein
VIARRRGSRVVPMAVLGATLAPVAVLAKEPAVSEGMYVSLDAGISRLEPRNRDGGYVVDDGQSLGLRLSAGYAWSAHWSAEAFYADGGKAGISSDNPAVGHLGDIEYKMAGVGVEWLPLRGGRTAKFFPLVKLGVVQITNSASSQQILYEKLNDAGLYLGGGAGVRFGESWIVRGEVVSYDVDELFYTFGFRKHF